MSASTVAGRWGDEIADRLARWAIDTMLEPPTEIATFATHIPAHVIREGRSILDDAGWDWRAFKRSRDNNGSAHNARGVARP